MAHEYSKSLEDSITDAETLARKYGHERTSTELLLYAILERETGIAVAILNSTGSGKKLKADLHPFVTNGDGVTSGDKIYLTPELREILDEAGLIADEHSITATCPEHFILSVTQGSSRSADILHKNGISYDKAMARYSELRARSQQKPREDLVGVSGGKEKEEKEKPVVLDNLCRNLTKLAEEGNLDPVIGRTEEIARTIQILQRKTKNNPVLLGAPGVGKTAIMEGVAQEFVKLGSPKQVYLLDIGSVVAGTKYRGMFEERIKGILKECSKNENIILCIDELHTLIGAGAAEGAIDASNMLKPALSRGEIRVIGATTSDDYRRYVEKDGALSRRFQSIKINEPSVENTKLILDGRKDQFERHHGVTYSAEAMDAAVILSDRYIRDRHFPDKAVDVLDEAGSRIRVKLNEKPEELTRLEGDIDRLHIEIKGLAAEKQFEKIKELVAERDALDKELHRVKADWQDRIVFRTTVVTEDDVASVVSNISGVPVNRLTISGRDRFRAMENELPNRFVSQQDAKIAVTRAIKRGHVGLKEGNRPLASFVFLGSTGVGKTELAKLVAELFYEDPEALIRLDMSEYMDKFSASRLIGAPPGYTGYDDACQLEKVRQKPYSVVLVDEIDKAHPDVLLLWLQILDEGKITDSQNRVIDFQHTIIIMTSNFGSKVIKNRTLGFGVTSDTTDWDEAKERVMESFKKALPPELINRFDEVIVFQPLTEEDCEKIIDIEIDKLNRKFVNQRVEIHISDEIKKKLLTEGFNEEYGARPIKRTIRRVVIDPLSDHLLDRVGEDDQEVKKIQAILENGVVVFNDVKA